MKTQYTCSCGRTTDNVYWRDPDCWHRKLEQPICWDCYERGVIVSARPESIRPAADTGSFRYHMSSTESRLKYHGRGLNAD